MAKISVYVSEEQKKQIEKFAQESNLTLSEYLLRKGLKKEIKSDRFMAELASFACKLYSAADEIENADRRRIIKEMSGELYDILENKVQD